MSVAEQENSLVLFLRQANTAVKYIVSLAMFVICVWRTRPGVSVLPAYYLICSLLLAVVVKALKRLFQHKRPGVVSSPSSSSSPNVVVGLQKSASSSGKFDDDDDDNDNDANDNDEKTIEVEDDDHGMPSSHSAMLSYFSWTAVVGIWIYNAFDLYACTVTGLIGLLYPLLGNVLEAARMLNPLMMDQERQAKLDFLASSGSSGDASTGKTEEAIMCFATMFGGTLLLLLGGVLGAQLRVWNNDHTIPQALVGYLIGFVWTMLSVMGDAYLFRVNAQSYNVQLAWMVLAVVMGIVGAYVILIVKKTKIRVKRHSE